MARKRTYPLQIDLQNVMVKKLGTRRMKWIPDFFVKGLEKMICVPQINDILAYNKDRHGADFATGVLEYLNVKVDIRQQENLPPASERRVMFVSNHPMGGIEGVAMIDFMKRYYGGQFYVMVNDILMALEPLQNIFVPVNKHGRQTTQTLQRLDNALAADAPVLIFPAGWVSRLHPDGHVADYKWYKTFVNKAIESRRRIIPMFCTGRNSSFFYHFAHLRERLGMKFNVEMVQLPREVIRMRNRSFSMICGKPVDWRTLRGGRDAAEDVARIRNLVYAMEPVAQ